MDHDSITQLTVQIDGSFLSEQRLNDITLKLKADLAHLKPLAIDLKRDQHAPDGSMSVEAITAGAILIAVLPTMVPAVIEYLREWCLRNANHTITIKRRTGEQEIEVSFPEDLSSERLQRLMNVVSDTISKSNETNQK
jgi:hypothetical protein